MRIPQPIGNRGSLKWIQRVAEGAAPHVDREIVARLSGASHLEWRSPRADDDYAEYRDGAFLDLIGQTALRDRLKAFWPRRGPQWDGLATTDGGHVVLVEAKAHVGELRSSGSQASPASRLVIESALKETVVACGATAAKTWTETYYQLANRLAHLYFLRGQGVDAYLLLMNFVSDGEMNGPSAVVEWHTAYNEAEIAMGLSKHHAMTHYILHVYPDVREFA